MQKTLKLWTGLGLATLGGISLADAAGTAQHAAPPAATGFIFVQDGEGGEGGGGTIGTYSISTTDEKAFDYEASAQLSSYADLAHAGYAESVAGAKTLEQAIDALLANPDDATLAVARKAWVEARPAYLKTEAFRFYDGPIEDVEGQINAWPLNEAAIDYVEGKPDAGIINAAAFIIGPKEIAEANQKADEADVTMGWHAIEFLLWGQDKSASGPGNRPASDFVAGQGNNDRRRAYLKLVAHELVEKLEQVEEQWAAGSKDNYRARFLALPQREAIGRIVNGLAILAGFEFMSERLSVALDSGDQEDEHSCFSDTTKQDFVYDLVGIRQVWTGDDGRTKRSGIGELVRARKPELAAKLDALLADAEAKIAALGDPWDQVLASAKDSPQRKAAEEAVAALQALGDGFKQVGNELGVIVLIPSG
jgi:putative iron-regulated protein